MEFLELMERNSNVVKGVGVVVAFGGRHPCCDNELQVIKLNPNYISFTTIGYL